jgi:hypothetical protein
MNSDLDGGKGEVSPYHHELRDCLTKAANGLPRLYVKATRQRHIDER